MKNNYFEHILMFVSIGIILNKYGLVGCSTCLQKSLAQAELIYTESKFCSTMFFFMT